MITPRQIRAARGLLGWEATELGKRTNLSRETIANIESGRTQAREGSLDRITKVFTDNGVEFTANQGVRLKSSDVEIFEGPGRFDEFYDFLYEHLKQNGGEVCLSITDETLLSKYRKDPLPHYNRMQDLNNQGVIKSFRILTNKGYFSVTDYSYQRYRWRPASSVAPTAFYVFGDCLALISFVHENPPYVVVLQSAPIAASYIEAFDAAWQAGKEPNSLQKGDI